MEMLVIAVIALLAFTAVLVPLFRRRAGFGDEREFENVPPSPNAEPTADSTPGPTAESGPDREDELELEVERYRAAVRADTVCGKCGQANPADAAFCFECGAALPPADAREFE